jgi:3-isopropylmalate dehydrogenase
VIVRENTEGFYADRNMFSGSGEMMPTPDLALSLRKITREGSTRIVEEACRLRVRRRRKLTAVHKANVLRVSDGLFLECARDGRAALSAARYEEKIVDAVAALLVRDASRFDVIVTTNMFGDILSDEASEIAGSLGLAESLNAGAGTRWRRRSTARRPTSPERTRPIRLADRLGRDAARLARRAARRCAAHAGGRGNRARARCCDRQTGMAHRRSRRPTRHQGIRCACCRPSRSLTALKPLFFETPRGRGE